MALISYIDGDARRIYLSANTMNVAWHPVDLYREIRMLRKNNESLRKYTNFMRGDGNVDKGGGKATERYFTLMFGTRIVPWDESHVIDVTGTLITDDGLEGVFCFNRDTLSSGVEVDIQYAPKQVEVITINTSGVGAQEVWEYQTRTLTSDTGTPVSGDVNIVSVNNIPVTSVDDFKADVSSIDLSSIPAEVWTYVTRELTVAAGLTPAQEAKLDEIIVDISEIPSLVLDEVAP